MKKGSATVRFPQQALALLLASFFLLACSFVWATAAPQAVGSDLLTEAEQTMFVKGQTLHSQGLYGEAVIVLNQFLELYPNSVIKDLGLLWLGRSYLAQGDIVNAEKTGLRLKAVHDSDMVGIYEEELRIARQNYAKLAAPSHTRTDIAVNKTVPPASFVAPQPSIDVAASRPAVQVPKPVASPAATPPTINKVIDPAPGETVAAKESAVSGLFLPAILEIPAEQRGVGIANVLRPLRPATAAPAKQHEAEKQSITSISARGLPAANNPMVAPPKESGAVKASPNVDLPLLRTKIEKMPGVAATDGTVSYRLIITNEGSGVAKDLTVRGELDVALDYAASDPSPNRQELIAQKQVLTFRLPVVQPGETKVVQISVRPRGAVSMNIATQTKHSIFYRDSKGNFLHTP